VVEYPSSKNARGMFPSSNQHLRAIHQRFTAPTTGALHAVTVVAVRVGGYDKLHEFL
jgi:hypothetical protein